MEQAARDYFDRIEALGGVIPAIEQGSSSARLPRRRIAISASSTSASAFW